MAVAAILALITTFSLRRAAAERAPESAPSTLLAGLPAGLPVDRSEAGGLVVGEFEGSFDAATRRFTIEPKRSRGESAKSGLLYSRFDPGAEVLPGSGFSFSVVASKFIATGENPGTVSGEIQITNNTNATLYNTRLVFTAFKLGGPGGTDAGNLPGANGFAYFNDVQILSLRCATATPSFICSTSMPAVSFGSLTARARMTARSS